MASVSDHETVDALLPALRDLRRALHQEPDLSGEERRTAERVARFIDEHRPAELITGLGGHGVAAVYGGAEPGPTLLLRADLDAIPVAEPAALGLAYASDTEGVAHKCGHDGHMATVAGLAPLLARRPLRRGRVVLLFQPAEETGAGAARVLADRALERLAPDRVFAAHNLPGFPLGHVLLREGPFAWGSVGLAAELRGYTAHAGYPERGRNPAGALAALLSELPILADRVDGLAGATRVTVVHARLGERAFGVAPGEGELGVTLRAALGADLERLREAAVERLQQLAAEHELQLEHRWVEPFPATDNDAGCVAALRAASGAAGLEATALEQPFRWSEDFGHFTARYPGALFGLGAGETQPPLHHPDYDFPDALIGVGLRLFAALIRDALGVAEADHEV